MGTTTINTTGIRNVYQMPADVPVQSSVVPVSLNLGGTGGIAIKKNQTIIIEYLVKFSVGATGGIRFTLAVPAGGTIFSTCIQLNNTVAPSIVPAVQQSSAAFTNALANAGTHFILITATIVNGNTAGKVDLQAAQNTSDALTATFLKAGTIAIATQF